MPSKKKKYNARFPPARIKKIMQTDEEVGKVAAAVPVIISRALELFIDSLIEKTATVTREKHAKTLSTSHIKQAIHSEKTFDFLRDLVKNVPDHQADEEDGGLIASSSGAQEPKPKQLKPRKAREPNDQEQGKAHRKRGPGRPKKVHLVQAEEKKESSSAETDSEETDTDEEQNTSGAEQSNQEQSMPQDMGGVTTTHSLSPGRTSNAQSTIQAPLSSSNITFPGTNAQLIQPPFPPAQVQAYPMHNIPVPQYPYPMQVPLCGPPQFAAAPSLNASNSPNPQFMPQMIPPFIPQPFFNMPPAGFMVSPAPSQACPPFQNVSNNICRPVLDTSPVHSVAMPQQDVDHGRQSSQKDDQKSNNSEIPLDMSVSGKSRSQSVTEPQTSMAQGPSSIYPSDNSRVNQQTPQLVSNNNQYVHSVGSSEQSVNKNGPVLHTQLRQDNSNQQNRLQKNKVKPEIYSEQGFSAVESKSVPKKENRSSDLNTIQYENLSNLMNQGPAKIANNEDDDDYDT